MACLSGPLKKHGPHTWRVTLGRGTLLIILYMHVFILTTYAASPTSCVRLACRKYALMANGAPRCVDPSFLANPNLLSASLICWLPNGRSLEHHNKIIAKLSNCRPWEVISLWSRCSISSLWPSSWVDQRWRLRR